MNLSSLRCFIKIILISGLALLASCKDFSSSADSIFKKTSAGKALYSCVSSSGDLKIISNPISQDEFEVNANLIKNKEYNLQFLVRKKINQVNLTGASVVGEEKLTKLALMLFLEMDCGTEIASQIMPDEYNALRLMQHFSR